MFGGGGFGGDVGNQFAGGGFMPSQANDAGYGGGGGSGGAKRGSAQTLRTLTIRQLAKSVGSSDDDHHVVDGVDLSNMTMVGKITDVQDKGNHLLLTITDGTGDLEVSYWLSEESEYAVQNTKAAMRRGAYIKAHGHLRIFDKKCMLSAFTLRAITNYNEITYHFLRAIFEHLHLTKGGAGAAAAAAAAQGMGGGFGNPVGGGWGGAGGAPQQPQQPGATAFAGSGAGDACQMAVMQIMQASVTDEGVHVEAVFNELSGQFSRAQIEQALQALVNDAHLYNTIDDYHYKPS